MSTFIADKPLSQSYKAKWARNLRLNDDPKAVKYAESEKKRANAKRDAKIRRNAYGSFPTIHTTKWNEIARYIAAGRDTGRIAIYLNMPEWIVKILAQHIAMTNAGQGTAAQNLEEANRVIKAMRIKGQQ